MCKAGFAGDDAPRAVFRKYFLLHLKLQSRDLLSFIEIRWNDLQDTES